jgi:hypothetical protein
VRMHRGSSNDFVTTGDVDVPESAFRYPPEVAFPSPPLFAPPASVLLRGNRHRIITGRSLSNCDNIAT